MPQPMGSYDESLLRDAPVATKQQLQEGYTTDLLASPSKPRSINRTQSPLTDGATAAIPPIALRDDLERGQRSQEAFNNYSEKPPNNRIPFWRTTKGIVLIAILAIVIIAVVVGAAVGTSVHKPQSFTSSSANTSKSPGNPVVTNPGSGGNGGVDATSAGGATSTGGGVGSIASAVSLLGPSSTGTSISVGHQPPETEPTIKYGILQSESDAIAALKQAGHYNPRRAYQASGNVDIS